MALTTGSTVSYSDIRGLFNRVNSERNRFGYSTTTPPAQGSTVTAEVPNRLKTLVQEMTGNSFLASAASTSSMATVSAGQLLTPVGLSALATILTKIEAVTGTANQGTANFYTNFNWCSAYGTGNKDFASHTSFTASGYLSFGTWNGTFCSTFTFASASTSYGSFCQPHNADTTTWFTFSGGFNADTTAGFTFTNFNVDTTTWFTFSGGFNSDTTTVYNFSGGFNVDTTTIFWYTGFCSNNTRVIGNSSFHTAFSVRSFNTTFYFSVRSFNTAFYNNFGIHFYSSFHASFGYYSNTTFFNNFGFNGYTEYFGGYIINRTFCSGSGFAFNTSHDSFRYTSCREFHTAFGSGTVGSFETTFGSGCTGSFYAKFLYSFTSFRAGVCVAGFCSSGFNAASFFNTL